MINKPIIYNGSLIYADLSNLDNIIAAPNFTGSSCSTGSVNAIRVTLSHMERFTFPTAVMDIPVSWSLLEQTITLGTFLSQSLWHNNIIQAAYPGHQMHMRLQFKSSTDMSDYSPTMSFCVEPYPVMTLTDPTPGEEIPSIASWGQVGFSWGAFSARFGHCSGSIWFRYQIQVDNNSDFSSPLFNEYWTTPYTNVKSIALGTYYWRVRALKEYAAVWYCQPWSSVRSFTVIP